MLLHCVSPKGNTHKFVGYLLGKSRTFENICKFQSRTYWKCYLISDPSTSNKEVAHSTKGIVGVGRRLRMHLAVTVLYI